MMRSMSEWISKIFTERITTIHRRITNQATDDQVVVVSNGNAEVRDDETVVDMSNTDAILIPQTSIAAVAIWNPRNWTTDMSNTYAILIPQTSIAAQSIWNPRNWLQGIEIPPLPGVANFGSGVPSQRSGLPPRPNAGRGNDIKALLINEGKGVAKWVISLSATGIFSAVSEFVGTKEAHEYIFTAFIILCYVSLVSGLVLNHLIRISPETRGFVKIVKFTIYFCQGTLLCATSCVVCLVFPSMFGVAFILVSTLIPFGLIAILSSARWAQVSIPP